MPAATVKPRHTYLHDTGLATTVRRCYGFQAYCACGWEGNVHERFEDARREANAHNLKERSFR
jgi:hypothetical protein